MPPYRLSIPDPFFLKYPKLCHIVLAMAALNFISEPRTGERVLLDKNKTIFGRHTSCDCRLRGKTVSREHFSIEHNNGKFFLVDLQSVNGTLANGKRVSWVELKHGDTIQAGHFVLVFEDEDEASVSDDSANQEPQPADAAAHAGDQLSFSAEHQRVYPHQYLEGIKHFNARRYFDAHEVWEEIWLHASDETKLFYQMLIQAAVGLHHYERGNTRGASGLYHNVIEKLRQLPAIYMSIDLVEFSREFKSFFAELIENESARVASNKPRPVINLLDVGADTGEHRTRWE
jgi:predicted metal-dependent hydrolase